MKYYIYRFLNKDNEIIYVGKARNILNRIGSAHNHLPKECYNETCKIEYMCFDTEGEILLAERYFIAKTKPKYNTDLKHLDIKMTISEFENREWIVFNRKEIVKKRKDERKEAIRAKKEKELREKEELRKQELLNQIDTNKSVWCKLTGEVFENMIEAKEFFNTNIVTIYEYCEGMKEGWLILHPVYNQYTELMYYDNYLNLSERERYWLDFSVTINTRKVICLTNGKVFLNYRQANEHYGICRVKGCCYGRYNYSGIEDGTPLVWKWLDEFEKMSNDEIDNYMKLAYKSANTKKANRKAITYTSKAS